MAIQPRIQQIDYGANTRNLLQQLQASTQAQLAGWEQLNDSLKAVNQTAQNMKKLDFQKKIHNDNMLMTMYGKALESTGGSVRAANEMLGEDTAKQFWGMILGSPEKAEKAMQHISTVSSAMYEMWTGESAYVKGLTEEDKLEKASQYTNTVVEEIMKEQEDQAAAAQLAQQEEAQENAYLPPTQEEREYPNTVGGGIQKTQAEGEARKQQMATASSSSLEMAPPLEPSVAGPDNPVAAFIQDKDPSSNLRIDMSKVNVPEISQYLNQFYEQEFSTLPTEKERTELEEIARKGVEKLYNVEKYVEATGGGDLGAIYSETLRDQMDKIKEEVYDGNYSPKVKALFGYGGGLSETSMLRTLDQINFGRMYG